MWIVAWALVAHAETPLPSYRDAVVREAWYASNDLLEAGLFAEADAKASEFQRAVTPDGTLEYLVALSWRLRKDDTAAKQHYQQALVLNPTLTEGWYDLGEVYLSAGEFDDAKRCFSEVADRITTGNHASLGPRRLAEVAAHQHDAAAFELNLHEALRRGFSFREIAGLPNWKGFYADPALKDSVTKMVTVYGEPGLLDTLKGP